MFNNAQALDPSGLRYATAQGAPQLVSVGNLNLVQGAGMQNFQGTRPGLTGLPSSAAPQQAVGQRFVQAGQVQQQFQLTAAQRNLGMMQNPVGNTAVLGARAGLGALGNAPNLAGVRPGLDRGAAGNLGAINLGAGVGQASAAQLAAAGLNFTTLQQQQQRLANAANLANNAAFVQQRALQQQTTAQQLQSIMGGAAGAANFNQPEVLLATLQAAKNRMGGNFMGGPNAFGAVGGQGGLQAPQEQMEQQQGLNAFDANDFPALNAAAAAAAGNRQGGRNSMSNDGPSLADAFLRGKNAASVVGAGATGAHQAAQEFSIQSEDFPALPGTTQPPAAQAQRQQDESRFQQQFQAATANRAAAAAAAAGGHLAADHFGGYGVGGDGPGYDQQTLLRMQQQQQQQQGKGPAKGGDPQLGGGGGGGAKSTPMGQDRYGLLGLLSVIKMTDPDLTMLALGTDLTSLGLNLNSPETLYKSLSSPLSDSPLRGEPDVSLPACYKLVPQRLQAGFLTKFKEETLFYIFYSMPQDEAQVIAADELCTRGWFWHRRYKCWMTHAPNTAVQKGTKSERATVLFWDPATWEYVTKADVEILYDDVEAPPRLPRPKHLQPGGGGAGAGPAAGGRQ